jgi:hypothetical protein
MMKQGGGVRSSSSAGVQDCNRLPGFHKVNRLPLVVKLESRLNCSRYAMSSKADNTQSALGDVFLGQVRT